VLKTRITKQLFLVYTECFQNHPRFSNGKAAVNNGLLQQRSFKSWSLIFSLSFSALVLTITLYVSSPIILFFKGIDINNVKATIFFVGMYAVEALGMFGASWIIMKLEEKYWEDQQIESLDKILLNAGLLNTFVIDGFIAELKGVIAKENKKIESGFTLVKWCLGTLLTVLAIFAGLKKTVYTSELTSIIIFIGVVITLYVIVKFIFGRKIGNVVLNRLHNLEFLEKELRGVKTKLNSDRPDHIKSYKRKLHNP
jgi:hypothetical protein